MGQVDNLGPVARSLVSPNPRWLKGIKTCRFLWYITLVSANHDSSNPGLRFGLENSECSLRQFHFKDLVPVVQTIDSAIRRINHYPLDNSIDFASVYPLDSDLSGGYSAIHRLNNWGLKF